MLDDDLKTARRRAERAITEDGFLDIRNIKFPKAEVFDEEVCMLLLLCWALTWRWVAMGCDEMRSIGSRCKCLPLNEHSTMSNPSRLTAHRE